MNRRVLKIKKDCSFAICCHLDGNWQESTATLHCFYRNITGCNIIIFMQLQKFITQNRQHVLAILNYKLLHCIKIKMQYTTVTK